jgi:hypothetical protein
MELEQREKNHIGWAVFITLFGLLYAVAGFWILYACFTAAADLLKRGTVFEALAGSLLNKTIAVDLAGLALMWAALIFGTVVKGQWFRLEDERNRTILLCTILTVLGGIWIFV